MREVSKAEFREIYFRYARAQDGWSESYWLQFYEQDRDPPMKYRIELPQSPDQTRMMIVDDYGAGEHRLFFLSEAAEDDFFRC